MTQRRSDMNYRLPKVCCMTCTSMYINSYGDNQCLNLPGEIIDLGGMCDLYNTNVVDNNGDVCIVCDPTANSEVVLQDTVEEEVVRCCCNCTHSFEHPGEHVPYCSVDGYEIEEDTNTYSCRAYEQWRGPGEQ